jgi:GT2 family glycosyltransferase
VTVRASDDPPVDDVRITAILTSHDRRQYTLRCLDSLFGQVRSCVDLDAVLADDGSRDGTAEAVRARFPRVRIVVGDGSLFWAAGMALAEREARRSRPNYLLWLNDDVTLEPTALSHLLQVSRSVTNPLHVIGGPVYDPVRGTTSYGGVRRRDWHPLRFELVSPTGAAVDVDTIHGNVVLVPMRTADALGSIDGAFEHAYADFDYGLRLRQHGGTVVLAPDHVGTCADNDCKRQARAAPWPEQWRFLLSRKGMPVRSHVRYLRRHGGPVWPLVAGAPYARALAARVVRQRPVRAR